MPVTDGATLSSPVGRVAAEHALRCEWWKEQVAEHGRAGAAAVYAARLPKDLATRARHLPGLHDAWTLGLVRGKWVAG